MPRIATFLPADHLLEIAPGHGRITRRGPLFGRGTKVLRNSRFFTPAQKRLAGEIRDIARLYQAARR